MGPWPGGGQGVARGGVHIALGLAETISAMAFALYLLLLLLLVVALKYLATLCLS